MLKVRDLTMSHWMFNCKDVSKKVSESMDRTLPLHERMMITIHLWMCKYCNRFKNQLLVLRKAVRQVELPEMDTHLALSLPQETCGRIKRALKDLSS